MMMKFTTPLKTLAAALLLVVTVTVNGEHYEIPPCQSDEKAVQIMGVEGIFCSPLCGEDGDSCPNDVPDGVTAKPSCALKAPTGEGYCAILCSAGNANESKKNGLRSSSGIAIGDGDGDGDGAGQCGSKMTCSSIPNSGGLGLCDYIESSKQVMVDMNSVITVGVATQQ